MGTKIGITSDFAKLARKLVAPLLLAERITPEQALIELKLEDSEKNRSLMQTWKYREKKMSKRIRAQRLEIAQQNWDATPPKKREKIDNSCTIVNKCQEELSTSNNSDILAVDLAESGIALINQHVRDIRENTLGTLSKQKNILVNLFEQLEVLSSNALDAKEAKLIADTLDKLSEILSKVALIPYGLKDVKPAGPTHKSVHFHSYGLANTEPVPITRTVEQVLPIEGNDT